MPRQFGSPSAKNLADLYGLNEDDFKGAGPISIGEVRSRTRAIKIEYDEVLAKRDNYVQLSKADKKDVNKQLTLTEITSLTTIPTAEVSMEQEVSMAEEISESPIPTVSTPPRDQPDPSSPPPPPSMPEPPRKGTREVSFAPTPKKLVMESPEEESVPPLDQSKVSAFKPFDPAQTTGLAPNEQYVEDPELLNVVEELEKDLLRQERALNEPVEPIQQSKIVPETQTVFARSKFLPTQDYKDLIRQARDLSKKYPAEAESVFTKAGNILKQNFADEEYENDFGVAVMETFGDTVRIEGRDEIFRSDSYTDFANKVADYQFTREQADKVTRFARIRYGDDALGVHEILTITDTPLTYNPNFDTFSVPSELSFDEGSYFEDEANQRYMYNPGANHFERAPVDVQLDPSMKIKQPGYISGARASPEDPSSRIHETALRVYFGPRIDWNPRLMDGRRDQNISQAELIRVAYRENVRLVEKYGTELLVDRVVFSSGPNVLKENEEILQLFFKYQGISQIPIAGIPLSSLINKTATGPIESRLPTVPKPKVSLEEAWKARKFLTSGPRQTQVSSTLDFNTEKNTQFKMQTATTNKINLVTSRDPECDFNM